MTNQLAPAFIGADLNRGAAGVAVIQRIYIAGPMSGYAELNFPAFHHETAALRRLGHTVVNPAEINVDPATGWAACMRADIAELVTCDRIHLLPGWSKSRGATLEHHIGHALGLMVTRAEGAEAMPEHFGYFVGDPDAAQAYVSKYLNRAVAATAEGASQPTAAVTNVSHEAALAVCQKVADYHQQQLKDSFAVHGYHTAVTQAHGYQYLGAQRCIEALRIAARAEG